MEVKVLSIGQICKRFSSGKNITSQNISEEGVYPVYGGNGLRGYTDTYNFEGECAIVGRQGAYCGNVKYVRGKAYMSEHAIVAVTNSEHNNKYFYYKLSLAKLGRFSGQAAQPGLSVTKLLRLKLEMPSRKYQDVIASILSTYDTLIENNTKRIRLLEKMAENLYKEWFVRFRFPGHENVEMENGLPKGWKVEKLGEWGIELETGKRPKGGIDGSIKDGCPSLGAECIKELASFDYSSVKMVPKDFYDSLKRGKSSGNDILLYKDGAYIGKVTMFRDSFPYSEYSINEHVFFLSPMNVKYRNYLYFTLHQKEFFALMQNLNRNAAQPGLSRSDVERVKIVVPPSKIVEFFDLQVERMLKVIFSLAKQNSLLARQRDLLLPRLMSGKLEVKEELLE